MKKVKKSKTNENKLKCQERLAAKRIGYVKPNITLNHDMERRLARQATRGVVQLFNAVREHQKFLEKKLEILEKGTKTEKRKAMDEIKSLGSGPKVKKEKNE